MLPWFIWKGEDSRDKGIYVLNLPEIIRGPERAVNHVIPGRAGSVTTTEGEDIYDSYIKTFTIGLHAEGDAQTILRWLRGAGTAVFSNDPCFAYKGRIINQIEISKIGRHWENATATIQMYTEPYKMLYPAEGEKVLANGSEIINIGDVTAHPKYTLTGTGADVTINGLTLEAVTGEVVIDTDTGLITQGGELWDGEATGDMPLLAVGKNVMTISGVDNVTIKPRWRFI